MSKSRLAFLLLSSLAACTDDTSSESAEVRGAAAYRDATTDHAGNPQVAASPSGRAEVTVTVEGTAQLPQVDPRCALDPAGVFEATFTSTADLADGSAYVAALGTAAIATPSGCELPDLSGLVVTGVRIRAELEATTPSCQTYCAAHARAEGEAMCGATPAAAECRANAEATATASCTTQCTTQSSTIVAETSLSAGLLGTLDDDGLRAAAFGDLEANLVFDTLE